MTSLIGILTDSHLKSLKFIAYLDDVSKCVTCSGIYKEATMVNVVLEQVDAKFGTAQIITDYGTQFTLHKNKPKKTKLGKF